MQEHLHSQAPSYRCRTAMVLTACPSLRGDKPCGWSYLIGPARWWAPSRHQPDAARDDETNPSNRPRA